MTISPTAGDRIQFESTLDREERRPRVELLDTTVKRADRLVYMCAWCKRVQADTAWVEVEVGLERLGLFGSRPGPGISHGICPACEAVVRRDLPPRSGEAPRAAGRV